VYKKKKISNKFKGNALPYCQYCGITGVYIERHHIIKRSQGGKGDDRIRIDLCVTGPNNCHKRADNKEEGYKPKDLYWKKWEDKKRRRNLSDMF